MSKITDYARTVAGIRKADPRYARAAYDFVMAALEYTQGKLKRRRHVRGQEVLEGIREYGIEEYGALTRTVFEHWGVRGTEDFGEIVFNLVNAGILGKTEDDSMEDFRKGYDFQKAFEEELDIEV